MASRAELLRGSPSKLLCGREKRIMDRALLPPGPSSYLCVIDLKFDLEMGI